MPRVAGNAPAFRVLPTGHLRCYRYAQLGDALCRKRLWGQGQGAAGVVVSGGLAAEAAEDVGFDAGVAVGFLVGPMEAVAWGPTTR